MNKEKILAEFTHGLIDVFGAVGKCDVSDACNWLSEILNSQPESEPYGSLDDMLVVFSTSKNEIAKLVIEEYVVEVGYQYPEMAMFSHESIMNWLDKEDK